MIFLQTLIIFLCLNDAVNSTEDVYVVTFPAKRKKIHIFTNVFVLITPATEKYLFALECSLKSHLLFIKVNFSDKFSILLQVGQRVLGDKADVKPNSIHFQTPSMI